MVFKRIGVALLCAAAAGTTLSACGSSSSGDKKGLPDGTIKIGALFTLSGPSAPIGLAQKDSFTVLVDRLNEQGGIAGRRVELVSENDKGDPAVAVGAARKLAGEVAAIVYAGTSATIHQTVPIFMKARTPLVMINSADEFDDPDKYPYLFETYPSDSQSMKTMAEWARSQGTTRLGIVTDGLPYGQNLIDQLKPIASSNGLQLAGPVTYAPTAVDVTTQLRQLKSQGADGIALVAAAGLDHVYDGLRTLGWSVPVYTTAVAYFVGYDSLGSLAPTTYSNCNVPLQPGERLDGDIATVLRAVSDKTGVSPNTPTAVVFNDDLGIVKEAIEQARSIEPDAMKDAIEGMSDFHYTSPLYRYSFSASDHNGYPDSGVAECKMKPLGPFDYPYAAETQAQK